MLSFNDILTAFTLKLNLYFSDIDIYIDDIKQGFDKSCFFVELIPLSNSSASFETNRKSFSVDIQYFSDGDKASLYNMISKLNAIFTRNIKVKDRSLTFKSIDEQIVTDEVGKVLHFIINIEFDDEIIIEKEKFEVISEVNLSLKEGEDI